MPAEKEGLKFSADRDVLLDGFVRSVRAIESNMSGSIYQGLLCEAVNGDGMLNVTGTSSGRGICVAVPVSLVGVGRCVVPGKLFTEVLKKMPEGDLAVEHEGGAVKVSMRDAGDGGPEFSIRVMAVDDYPPMSVSSSDDSVTVSGDVLSSAIDQVAGSASTDNGRPVLTGVLIESKDGRMRLVATDSYRMAVRDLTAAAVGRSGLVGARDLSELEKTIGAEKVNVVFDDQAVVFSSERGVLRLPKLIGHYPEYRKLLTGEFPSRMTFDRGRMLEALGRALLISKDGAYVKFQMSAAGILITAQQDEVGSGSEMVDGALEGPEDEIEVAYNPNFLRDGVAAVEDDDVSLELVDGLKPGMISGREKDGFRYLIMPVRIQGLDDQ